MVFGVITFVLVLLVLIVVHEWGHFAAARFLKVGVEEFGIGFPPAAYKKRLGSTVYSINWLPLGGFVRIKGEDASDTSPDSFSVQPAWKRALIIGAGIIMNLLLAAVLLSAVFAVGVERDITAGVPAGATVSNVTHRVMGVLPDTPADGVLLPGDTIASINGIVPQGQEGVQELTRAAEGGPVSVVISRDGMTTTHMLTPQEFVVPGSDRTAYGFGVQLMVSGMIQYPWYRAPLAGLQETIGAFGLIGATLGSTLVDAVRGSPSPIDVAGPVGIAMLTGEVAQLGPLVLLQFVAILSINLAFINLLPIPALDGGRLLFIVIESIRRRPLAHELEARIHRYGFAVLILLVLLVTAFDIARLDAVSGFISGTS